MHLCLLMFPVVYLGFHTVCVCVWGGWLVGKGGYLPPNLSYPLLELRRNLFLHATISQLQPSGTPEATRSNLGEPKILQISWGSTPNPLPPHKSCVLYIIECFPSLNKKSCIKPWHVHVYTVCIVTCVTEERMRESQECSHYVVISTKDPDTHKQCH